MAENIFKKINILTNYVNLSRTIILTKQNTRRALRKINQRLIKILPINL